MGRQHRAGLCVPFTWRKLALGWGRGQWTSGEWGCWVEDTVGEAEERERTRRREARAGAVQSWNGHPELSLPSRCHGNHIPPPPASLQTIYLSLSLSTRFSVFLSCLFHSSFNLCFLFPSLLHAYSRICDDVHSASSIFFFNPSVGRWWVITQFILHSQAPMDTSTWLSSHWFSIFFCLFLLPFCSAPCFSNAPSSHHISAHTGHLAAFLLRCSGCQNPCISNYLH